MIGIFQTRVSHLYLTSVIEVTSNMELRQHSILRISDENTMKLIDLYEKEECLWNTYSEQYKSRMLRQQAVQRIVEKLNIPHFTARYVVIKFKNLRNSYCQELKKMAKSAYYDPLRYKPKVFWFKKMDSFLRPHLQQHQKDPDLAVFIKSEPTDSEELVQPSNPEDVSVNESNYDSDSQGSEGSGLLVERSRSITNSSTASKRPRLEEPQESDLTRMLKDISSHVHVMARQKDDSFDSFGKYVSAMLRNMPEPQALKVQPRIIDLLVAATLNTSKKSTGTEEDHSDPFM